ncbi:MAG: hypothetical protein ABIY55_03295, partial [Kofleriaceae bacterium]
MIGGGDAGFNALDSIERATINADGTLGSFTVLPGARLRRPNAYATSVTIGDWFYVIGGGTQKTSYTSVERAAIGVDGSLGQFEDVVGATLPVAARHLQAVVLGTWLYVLGGEDAVIERAAIDPDGSLGPFAAVPGFGLDPGANAAGAVVVDDMLYILGGLAS